MQDHDTIPDLTDREGLPEALRTLLQDYPPESWEAHPNFSGLVQFWLERHMMFRQLGEVLRTETQALIDGKMAPREQGARLSRFGGILVNQLHGHHQIEDHHYFPVLQGLEPRLERGFAMLDRDHHAIDPMLQRFAERANGLLEVVEDDARRPDRAGAFLSEVEGLEALLQRHLTDEEELIVPVILKNGADGLH